MSRPQPPLAALLSAAIVTGSLVLGSAITARACPFADAAANPETTLRQPDASNDSSGVTRLSGGLKQQSFGYAEVAGIGVIVGLFAIALLCSVRRSQNAASAGAEFFSQHPQLEHPELTLTSIPKEALPSVFDQEAVVVR